MIQISGVSKHANFYPMLSEEALAELAADIKENGQRSPITVTKEGVLLDGRNRIKACEIAGVEPEFTVYDGDDEGAFVRSSNERRHQSTGSRAMSTALSLVEDGKREKGRWAYGSMSNFKDSNNSTFRVNVSWAGVVLDELPNLAAKVVSGDIALDVAYKQASQKRETREKEEQRRIEEQRDEQKREDQAGRYFDNHPEAKAWLDAKPQGAFETMRGAYAAYMEHDREARRIEAERKRAEEKKQRELDEGYERGAHRLRLFLSGYDQAMNMRENPDRDQILAKLNDTDKTYFLKIEEILHA